MQRLVHHQSGLLFKLSTPPSLVAVPPTSHSANMSDARVNRVVFVETTTGMQTSISYVFSRCGKITGVYPYNIASKNGFACFLEFAEEESVKRARAVQIPDMRVHVVAFSPQLVAHFNSIANPSLQSPVNRVKQEYCTPDLATVENEPHVHQDSAHMGKSNGGSVFPVWALKKRMRRGGKRRTEQLNRQAVELALVLKRSSSTSPGPPSMQPAATSSSSRCQSPSSDAMFSDSGKALTKRRHRRAAERLGLVHPDDTCDFASPSTPARRERADWDKENRAESGPQIGSSYGAPSPLVPYTVMPLLQRLSHASAPLLPASQASRPSAARPASSSCTSIPVQTTPDRSSIRFPHVATPQEENTQNLAAAPNADGSRTLPPRASSCITLSIKEEEVDFDLETLEEDPQRIITLLRDTANRSLDRNKWMIVSGHYRSKGNVDAAISVITAMIEVMMLPSISMTARDLKPAFLMLSTCHRELALRKRGSGDAPTDESREHSRKAAECLRQVYGTDVPVQTSDFNSNAAKISMNVSTPPALDLTRVREYLANTSNLPRVSGAANSSRRRDQGVQASRYDSHIQVLDREIQALRDRITSHGVFISEARTAKRKLEDELTGERHTRRRLERQLDDASRELAGAQRMENYALEQCRLEVEARRKAEDRAEHARAEAKTASMELQKQLAEVKENERRTRECFGKLGAMFTRAAKGDMEGLLLRGTFAGVERASSVGRGSETSRAR